MAIPITGIAIGEAERRGGCRGTAGVEIGALKLGVLPCGAGTDEAGGGSKLRRAGVIPTGPDGCTGCATEPPTATRKRGPPFPSSISTVSLTGSARVMRRPFNNVPVGEPPSTMNHCSPSNSKRA